MEWSGRALPSMAATFGAAQPGPEHRDVDIVLAEPHDAATTLANTNAADKVILAERGNATFVKVAMNAQTAGASAVIICNNLGEEPMRMGSSLEQSARDITIPVVSISQVDGAQLAAAIKAGATTISLQQNSARKPLLLCKPLSAYCVTALQNLIDRCERSKTVLKLTCELFFELFIFVGCFCCAFR